MHLSHDRTNRPVVAGSADPRRAEATLDAVDRLRVAVSSIQERERTVIGAAGLTGSQFAVLEVLGRKGPTCLRDLAEGISKSSSNLTTVVDNLERRGLVQRHRSLQDRREVTVWLTVTGREVLKSVLPRYVDSLVEALSRLTSGEQRQLALLCRRLSTGREPAAVVARAAGAADGPSPS